jgi:hypothetical protein
MNKWISIFAALLLAIGIDANGFAQSDSVIVPGGAIYDNTTGTFLGFVNRATGREERLTATLATSTNDSAAAGSLGEVLTATVASGSAVSLTTATSANIATLSVTAGDWDCAAQVTHNAAATTSVTLLQIGISVTTATLPTQAGGSGIGPDPLSIFRQAAAVPGGALTTNVGPVRVSLSVPRASTSWRTTPSPCPP